VLIERLVNQGRNMLIPSIEFSVSHNRLPHQVSHSECGMYVLYFTVALITDEKDVDDFKKLRIPDSDMRLLRHVYFR